MQFCHKNIPSNKTNERKLPNAALGEFAARFAESLIIVSVSGTMGADLRLIRRIEPNWRGLRTSFLLYRLVELY